MSKKTVVIGASSNPERYSYLAAKSLIEKDIDVVLVGVRRGDVEGIAIHTNLPPVTDVDTVTLYLSAKYQEDYFEYIWSLKPRRIIFNPGTENLYLAKLAREKGIKIETGCTLVMLSLGFY